MKRKVARLCIVVFLTACDDAQQRSPAAPTPSPIAPAPAPGGLTGAYALSGVVTAAGLPVAGATVSLLTFETGTLIKSTLTAANGSYSLSEVQNVSPASGALVSVSMPEYFAETRYVPMTRDETSDFDVVHPSHISVGERIRSRPGDARCASLGYGGRGGTPCQRFALTIPVSGTLEVEVDTTQASAYNGDVTILKPDGTIGIYASPPGWPLRLTLQVGAGLTYQIDVVHRGPPGFQDFELTTALR
jgi:hypothetical protein